MLRFATLLALGALAVHQLRYLLAGTAPAGSVHGYLGPAASVLAGFMVLALARVLVGRAARAPRLRVLWPSTALGLVGIFCIQETAEGLSPLAHGGWVALPLALVVALGVAALARSADRAAASAQRPWSAPAPAGRAVLLTFALPHQARPGAPRLLPARGPPCTS